MRATAKAIVPFLLVLVMAGPALAGPENSTIGGKKLQTDTAHSVGVGYPSVLYEWWNRGKGSLDWGLSGELVYANWASFTTTGTRQFGVRTSSDGIRIGLGISGILRWHLATKKRSKVTNDIAFLFKPGILFAGNTARTFTFAIKPEFGVPVSIDVHDRVSVVTGGFIPLTFYLNQDIPNGGTLPLLVRIGVEIDAGKRVAPWFYFDFGPALNWISSGPFQGTDGAFAWRLAAGTAFWGVLGKNKNRSDAAEVGRNF